MPFFIISKFQKSKFRHLRRVVYLSWIIYILYSAYVKQKPTIYKLVLYFLILVTPRRVELRFTGWKPAVLTARRWGQNKKSLQIFYLLMVGKTRLELATPASQTQCASQLRHFPTCFVAWWVCLDLNQGPRPYQRRALTNWATHPQNTSTVIIKAKNKLQQNLWKLIIFN